MVFAVVAFAAPATDHDTLPWAAYDLSRHPRLDPAGTLDVPRCRTLGLLRPPQGYVLGSKATPELYGCGLWTIRHCGEKSGE